MFVMKWNGIMENFLIDGVEKLPYLWNPRHPHFTKRLKKKLAFQQIAMRMSERWPALQVFFTPEICTAKFQNLRTYYRNEKKILSSFTSGTGARDFAPKWEHFTRLQFLDDTIEPLDSTSNLDYMELEINATPLNVSMEDAFQNVMELPPIPCSEEPQGARVSPSTPLLSTSKPKAKKRKVDNSREAFYESMQKCLGAVGEKTVNDNFTSLIASELNSVPCPKKQRAIRFKLYKTLFECLE
ncbi:MADF domain-containing protein [Trichonephila inaurata madagascariensis]|uniref:MADF domain-containing protein n=1 Tax=Trichonephila inaurata madagascariensis TaxID=2747483 RepID=A0A8X7C9K4_9ARAC|nr:MADF domain-containing protein [Trichonephila inaurata madagascariensis]